MALQQARLVAKLSRQTGEAVRKPTFGLILASVTCYANRSIGIAFVPRIAFSAWFGRVLRAVGPSDRTVVTKSSAGEANLPRGAWVAVRLFVVLYFQVCLVRVELPSSAVSADIVSVCVFFSVFTCRTDSTFSCGLLGRMLSGYTGLALLQRRMRCVIFAVVSQIAARGTDITHGAGNVVVDLEFSASAYSTVRDAIKKLTSFRAGQTELRRRMQRVIFAVVSQVAARGTGITHGAGSVAGVLKFPASAYSTV